MSNLLIIAVVLVGTGGAINAFLGLVHARRITKLERDNIALKTHVETLRHTSQMLARQIDLNASKVRNINRE